MTNYNKLVIFDCDGTLVDSQHMIIGAMHATYDALNLVRKDDLDIRSTVGLSPYETMATLEPDADSDFHHHMTAVFKQTFYERRIAMVAAPDPLYPGTLEALHTLKDEGYLLGVATGNSNRGLARVIEEHGLHGIFITLQTADNHPSKPHPSMIHSAMDDADSHENVTIMVGDTSFDMTMARAAKCHAIGVNWGYHSEDVLRKSGAHHVVNIYDELVPAIHALGNRDDR